MGYNFTHS